MPRLSLSSSAMTGARDLSAHAPAVSLYGALRVIERQARFNHAGPARPHAENLLFARRESAIPADGLLLLADVAAQA